MTCIIRSATEADIPTVKELTVQHDLAAKDPDQIKREGFLMSGYPIETYFLWSSHLRIAQLGEEVVGFTLRFRRADMPPEVDDCQEVIAQAGHEDFLLFKQVGVSVAHQRHGIGRQLYLAELHSLPC